MTRAAIVAFALALPVLAQPADAPGPHNVAYPTDYAERFIRYATVDKPDRTPPIVRFLYADPASFGAARPGAPLPDGTVLVMEDHRARLGSDGRPLLDQQGRLIPEPAVAAIFVQERRAGWGRDYPPHIRNAEWEYARFAPNGSGALLPGSTEGCFTCHLRLRAGQDYVFNFWDYVQDRPR